MGLTTDIEICELALAKIKQFETLSSDALTNPNTEAERACSKLFKPTRDAMIMDHNWRFAMKRVVFDIDDFLDTITASTAANPVVVTGTDISVANIVEGNGVFISGTGVSGLDNTIFVATNVVDAAQTLELYKVDRVTSYDGSSLGTASAGTIRLYPLFDYAYMYKLPTDCLRVASESNLVYNWDVEDGYLLTNNNAPTVQYVSLVETVSKYPKSFIECLTVRLGAELASGLAGDIKLKAAMLNELELLWIQKAYQLNAIERRTEDGGYKTKPSESTSWQSAGR